MTSYVAYVRVSTDAQGASGLGLEAQEATIRTFMRDSDKLVMPLMVEVESGTRRDRPVLRQALDRCRLFGATLILAKMDRLARDSVFVKTITRSDVPVVFCDVPSSHGATGRFIMGVLAEVGELEAGLISERTKAALKARKARGLPMGGDRGYRHAPDAARQHGKAGGAVSKAKADANAEIARSMIDSLRPDGADVSLNALARRLNEAGAKTPRGGTWTATAVRRVLARG